MVTPKGLLMVANAAKSWTWILAIPLIACVACRSSHQTDTAASSSVPPPASSVTHDPMHPPIDCPLRKAGIDPHGLKPFEDVEKYISFLERPDRAAWQKPDALVSSLALTGNEVVADVGAGSGYFTFRFSKALPHGRVVATDVEPEMVRHIRHKAMTEGVANIEVVLGAADDPKIPAGAALIFVCDVLHHVKDQAGWLSKMFAEAQSSARVVVVEFKEGELPAGPPAAVKLPHDQVINLVTRAGFTKVGDDAALLPYQYVLTFRKP